MIANLLAVAGVVIPFLGFIVLWLVFLEKADGKRAHDNSSELDSGVR